MPHIHELYDYTTSAFIMHPTEPKILLLLHIRLGKWLQPGGHVELNENPLQALHHELIEETGLQPNDYDIIEPAEQPNITNKNTNLLPLPFFFNDHLFKQGESHRHIDICYLIKAKTTKLTKDPDGASEIAWLSINEIRQKHTAGVMYDDTLQIWEWIFDRYLT